MAMSKPTMITVGYSEWARYTPRTVRMIEYYTRPDDISHWMFCDNGSDCANRILDYKFSLPTIKILAEDNIGDLPRYNKLMDYVPTEFAVFISTDVRIFSHDWIGKFLAPFSDKEVAIVGAFGPGRGMTPEHAGPKGGGWHWVPKLLVDRDIPFDDCWHVQTHCFAVRTSAFREVGGFWEPDYGFLIKGNLIAGEISLSVALRRAGWKLSDTHPPMHHYGNAAGSAADLDEFDRQKGWQIPF